MRVDVVGVARHWDEQALEAEARHEVNARVRCRLLALRQLALCKTVEQTAGLYMLGRNQLYHWIRRFEAQGLAGLKDRPRSGAPQRLAREREAAFVQRVLDGAGPRQRSGGVAGRGSARRAAPGVRGRVQPVRGVCVAAPAGAVEPGAAAAASPLKRGGAGGV